MTPLPDPDEVIVPDLAEPIRAYRVWAVAGSRLFGPNSHVEWPAGGPLVARCLPGPWSARVGRPRVEGSDELVRRHQVPCPPHDVATHDGHGCGIYGLARPAQTYRHALGLILPGNTSGLTSGLVYGEVALSGRYYQYSQGWRAERGRITALWILDDPETGSAPPGIVTFLAERYGVDATPAPIELRAALTEELLRHHPILHPRPVPRPQPPAPSDPPPAAPRWWERVIGVALYALAGWFLVAAGSYVAKGRWGYAAIWLWYAAAHLDAGHGLVRGRRSLAERLAARLLRRLRR